MLGRCRLRRGVSLEVIVEEDDQAEVTYDHSPLTEEDEDDDDSDMEGSSAPNGEGDVAEVLDEESERRRRRRAARARRRTIVGIPLDRMRSVSCEALTLLDTSDLDSCHSEWDDDDQNSNYVTLNRPISRKRILQNNSRSDSDDSGVEYHSNEEDPVLEMTSSNGDDIEHNMLTPQVKVTQIDTDITDVNEPDPLPEEVLQEQLSQNHDDLLQEDDLEEESQQDALEFELSHCVTPTVEETFEQLQLSGQFNQTDEETWIKVEDVQVADKDQVSNIREVQLQKQTEDQDPSQTQEKSEVVTNMDTDVNNDNNNNSTSSIINTSNRTNDLLENHKIVIVETTPSVPIRKAHHYENKDPVEEELRLKRQVYNIRNKEVRLEELPTPNTVSSVKELFENHHQNIDHFESFRQIGRFRDIKSNPSSKMLRFSRSKDADSSSASGRLAPPRSVTLPRLPSQHTKQSAARPSPRSSLAQRLAAAPVVTSLGAGRGGIGRRRQGALPLANNVGVALRKPQVRGFNVLKALAEDPRRVIQPPNSVNVAPVPPLTFHPVVTYSRSAPVITGKKTSQLQQHHHTSHSSSSSSYMDRSDCESLSSDTSEDSGVSGGSSSSSGDRTSSSSTTSSVFHHHHDHHIAYRLDTHGYRSLDSYSQDPSFKWIDPKVMSKIRAKGTTVIFFGPKHKKNSNGGGPGDLEPPSSRCSTPVFVLQPQAGPGAMAGAPQMAQTRRKQQKTPVPAPRIVGMVKKSVS